MTATVHREENFKKAFRDHAADAVYQETEERQPRRVV